MRCSPKAAVIAFAGILIMAAAAGAAAEWISIITINDVQMSVDTKSITYPSFQMVRAWRKYEFESPMKYESKELEELEVYTEEDCAGNKFRVLEEVMGFVDGSGDKNSYPDAVWENIAPDTFNFHFHAFVCKQGK